ncbi:unnamed protein product [Cylicocyclus nassatus]|uniref:Uncharacterized protein n=1 Tax=Cylicocyclus nassatus TaxID=53992 RepID=A0AA36DPI7_CYLNA|nr:unnamed protein product [Cylicocyclus nassatus]
MRRIYKTMVEQAIRITFLDYADNIECSLANNVYTRFAQETGLWTRWMARFCLQKFVQVISCIAWRICIPANILENAHAYLTENPTELY